ncbi:MAG: sulfurtransferase TusA family protein, partial [Armatimonadota bacterium]
MTDAPTAVPVPTQVDLTGEVCPMTFVRAKLHLAKLAAGELIEFVLKS